MVNFQNDKRGKDDIDGDIGFWVGLNAYGPWESVRSFLPLSVITKAMKDDYVAVDVVTKNGKKHAMFRGLATVTNDSDIKLEISSCDVSMINPQEHRRQQIMERGPNGISYIFLSPGSSSVLPWKCTSKDSNHCLQVRPCLDHSQTPYAWGHPVVLGSAYVLGKDQPAVEQGTLSRQNTLRQGNRLRVSPLKLNQLEKMDLLLCCPDATGKQSWLCIGTDASVLHTELNAPVYDWKLSVSSPLKLENRLPCGAEFRIWEKLKDGSNIERHRGYLSSRENMHIYSADIRNPLYLMLFLQGGWVLEKVQILNVNVLMHTFLVLENTSDISLHLTKQEPVLVLDLTSNSHASSFWMVHQHRKRCVVCIKCIIKNIMLYALNVI